MTTTHRSLRSTTWRSLIAGLFLTTSCYRSGGCDRPDPGDDDAGEMRPACKPGDQSCHAAEPSDTDHPAPIGPR